ncbi:MAG: porin [Saprospiraceae bacterium]
MSVTLMAQIATNKFGKGIQFQSKDTSLNVKMNVRFQNLMTHTWNLKNDDFGDIGDHEGNFLVRRARLKFGGWAYSPKVKFKLELGLSNRDLGGGSGSEYNKTANMILDAYVDWNFYKGFSLRFGQGKLPGSRERLISSSNLQFVDRSRLNSRFTVDRAFGFVLTHKHSSGDFIMIEKFSLSQGEGRNVIVGDLGGYEYMFKLEMLPFGAFASKGDYVGSAIRIETTPKLAIALSYSINNNTIRERGNKGSFITDNGAYFGKTLNTFFADLMFKFQRLSVMAEYADRRTDDGISEVYNDTKVIGQFYNGSAFNIQAGYMMGNNYEIAGRLTLIDPDLGVDNDDTRYTIGLSKFVVGHNLKVQTDFTYRSVTSQGNIVDSKDDKIMWRTQFELQF